MGWTTRVGGKDIYVIGKTTMVGGTDHTHYKENHRLGIYLVGRSTDINGMDHKGWWEGPNMS
jgi:hypothetical protein